MNCCSEEHPDCRYILKRDGYWICDMHKTTTINPEGEGCSLYELSVKYALRIALQKKLDDLKQKQKQKQLEHDIDWHDIVFTAIRDGLICTLACLVVGTLAVLILWSA